MSRSTRWLAAFAVLVAMRFTPAAAQQEELAAHDSAAGHTMNMHSHERAFTQGPRRGTIGAPHLDLNGGLYHVFRDPSDVNQAFLRLHAQMAIGIPYLGIASDLVFVPAFGATPIWSAVVQAEPIEPASRAYLSAGVGVITGHSTVGDRIKPWAQATVAYRLPLHEITPFVQVGRAIGGDGQHTELLVGIAHPLAPYRFHLP